MAEMTFNNFPLKEKNKQKTTKKNPHTWEQKPIPSLLDKYY